MAKKEVKKMKEMPVWFGVVVLLVGVLFLLRDVAKMDFTFGVDPWTVVFVLIGLKLVLKDFVK